MNVMGMTEQEALFRLQDIEYECMNSTIHYFTDKDIPMLQIARMAVEKQIPKMAEHINIKHGKHTWKRDSCGEIDIFAWEYEYHNGAVCKVCGHYSPCVLCDDDWEDEDGCEENYYICPTCGNKSGAKREYCKCGQKLIYE